MTSCFRLDFLFSNNIADKLLQVSLGWYNWDESGISELETTGFLNIVCRDDIAKILFYLSLSAKFTE